MTNKKFCLGMLVMVLVFGSMVSGCDTDSANSGGGGKNITITGITGKAGGAYIMAYSSADDNGIAAMGMGSVSGNSISFDLAKDEYMHPFTGSGSYYLMLTFESDNSVYIYTNGQTLAQLGITAGSSEADIFARLPKYNISSAASTIAFSMFKEAPPDW